MREKGLEVERRRINLPEPIKQLGDFTVTVKLESEVEASLKITVAAQPNEDLTNMIKLYDFLSCPFGQKVRIVLAEKGLTYELVQIDLTQDENRKPDFCG